MCKQELLKNIEEYRQEMVILASRTSFSNQKVIDVSTKLDNLMNEYENLRRANEK